MIQRVIRKSVVGLAVMAMLLFAPAGTLRWPAAWIYLLEVTAASFALTAWLMRHDPALLAERMAPLIQRDLMIALLSLWCAWFVLIGLDAVRYGWSEMPIWLQVLGGFGIIVGLYIVFLTMRVNSYAAPVVKIQTERGHRVVSDEPYAVVRHPMYGGALLLILGTPLLLGSWWGLATVPAIVVLLGTRAVMEERTLARELDGYADYVARVRYRLIPGVW